MLLLTCAVALVGLLVSLPNATATSITSRVSPSADAYVSQARPRVNFGSAKELLAGSRPKVRRSYLRFDLADLSGTVVKATLRLYSKDISRTGFAVRAVSDNSWNERTITYRTAPAPGPVVATMPRAAADAFTSVDVTGLVAAGRVVSLAVTAVDRLRVASRESGALGPQLIVEVASTSTSTTTSTTTTTRTSTTTTTLAQTATTTTVRSTTTSSAPVTTEAASALPYLTRQGSTLMLGGKTYRAVGVNAYGFATCEGRTYSNTELNAFFQALRPNGLTRSWATSRASIADLDRVVARAEANHQMLILSLADGANHCNLNDAHLDRTWYRTGYQGSYFDWIRTLVPRYVNSPAIGMWEIANEPGWGCNCGVTRDEYRSFFDNTAALIKSLDPHHLVESGTVGCCPDEIRSGTDFTYIHAGPNMDVASVHDYEYDYNGNTGALGSWSTYKNAAASLGKPIIVGETGALLNQPTNNTCRNSSMTIQALAKKKFDDYLSKGANAVLVWNWMKSQPSWVASGCGANQHYFYGTTDPVLQLIHDYPV